MERDIGERRYVCVGSVRSEVRLVSGIKMETEPSDCAVVSVLVANNAAPKKLS
jgi:hypothetical protein